MATISLTWKDLNIGEDGFNIYRSESPMDVNNMPPPIATVGKNIGAYNDGNVESDMVYYYRVGTVIGDKEKISDELDFTAFNSGFGPRILQAGDMNRGFFGEISPRHFITGTELSEHLGITQGTSIHDDFPWLKLVFNRQVLVTPMRPIRHSISWDAINDAGAVFDSNQSSTIRIGRFTYRITLFSMANRDPFKGQGSVFQTDPEYTLGTEWRELMYPLLGNWGDYSSGDFLLDSASNGRTAWGQETSSVDGRKVMAGSSNGVDRYTNLVSSSTNNDNGWRPVLRLIY